MLSQNILEDIMVWAVSSGHFGAPSLKVKSLSVAGK